MPSINTSDFTPAGIGISTMVREEVQRDGKTVMVVYTRAVIKDPATVPLMQQNEKGNVTLATVGQKAILPTMVLPSGNVVPSPCLTFSIWGPVLDREGTPLPLPVKVKREA